MILFAGQIVIVDWRDALPKEPNKRRPGIVVEDRELFDEFYPNAIVVPLTRDITVVMEGLTVTLAPTQANRLTATSHALCHYVTTVSKRRLKPTEGRVTARELGEIRRGIALSIGLDDVP